MKELTRHFEEKWGFNRETAWRLARLAAHLMGNLELEEWEKNRWRQAGVMQEDVVVFADEDECSDLTWVMYGLCWEGLVERKIENGQATYKITPEGISHVLSLLNKKLEEENREKEEAGEIRR